MNWQDKAKALLQKSLTPIPQELNELDWKEKLSPNKERLTQHLSAFANYPGGGFLVFGIEDNTGTTVGVTQEQVNAIIDKITNLSRNAIEPTVQINHFVESQQSKNLLYIYIEESAIKPVHVRGKTIEDSFIRSGRSTRKANRQEIGGLMLNSKTPNWEELHCTKLLNTSDIKSLLDYDSIHNLLGLTIPGDDNELFFWMENEKMVKKIDDGSYYITNFGAISSARILDKFDGLVRKGIRVIKYKGVNKEVAEREMTGGKGYGVGFEGLISFLESMLPSSEVIGKALRKTTMVYPELALREFIANAVIHQDFMIQGSGPMVEIFADRIEITNPGKLLPEKQVDRLIRTNPQSRNEVLAKAFRRYGICEERGTGIERAIIQIELFGLPPVKFENGTDFFRVILFMPRKFANMTLDERIQACYQHACIKYYSSSALTNASLRERFHMSERSRPQVSALIKEGVERKVIKARDPNASSKKMEYYPYWA